MFADFLSGHGSTKKKEYKFSKNIEKPPYRRVAQKKYNFAPGATNHAFFLTHPCIKKNILLYWINIKKLE